MKKFVALAVLAFVALFIPAINTFWTTIGNSLIDAFGITDATAMGRFFIVMIRIGPYAVPVLFVVLAFLIIRGKSPEAGE